MKREVLSCLLAVGVVAACSETPPVEPERLVVPVFATVSDNMETHLIGDEEVPPNGSRAQGQAIFQLNEDGTELSYRLNVANIENVTQSHIHRGAAGVAGGIVVWLYPSAPPSQLIPGRSQGTLATGVITDASVIGSLAGQGLAGLLAELRAGNTYVNVHTTQFPPGEIRGQID
jgi:hypothetical protein